MKRRSFLLALAARPARAEFLVQGALEAEVGAVREALSRPREARIEAWTFWSGKIGGKSVVVSLTGVGPAQAAAATAIGVREFMPRAVINQGTAGAHNRSLKLFDIVLGERTIDYSGYQSAHAENGQGVDLKRWKPRLRYHRGDARLISAAEKVPNPRGRVLRGTVGSANQFNRELDFIDWAHQAFGTDSEDMESAYAHEVCSSLNIPFLAIRMISDTEWEHPTFERIAGKYCAEFVVGLLSRS